MRAMTWLAFAFALGCSAQIPDGRIGCSDGQCPAGYNCWTDMLCHRAREAVDDAGMPRDVGMPIDANTPRGETGVVQSDAYGPCRVTPDCIAPLTCFSESFCTTACSAGTVCPGAPGSAVCVAGVGCVPTCTVPRAGGADTCPANSICAVGSWHGSVGGACSNDATIFPRTHGQACSAGCMEPEVCVNGACIRPCATSPAPCGGGMDESCAPVPMMAGINACLAPCTAETCAAGFTCGGMTGMRTCFPTVWGI